MMPKLDRQEMSYRANLSVGSEGHEYCIKLVRTKTKKKIAQQFFGSKTWIAKRPLGHRVAYPNLIKIIMS